MNRIALADPRRRRHGRRGVDGRGAGGLGGDRRADHGVECDLVLNAIVGSAGLLPTVATLGEGIDLALANKESLVVGGELVMELAAGHRRPDPPRRLRALGALPAAGGRTPGDRGPPDPDGLGRSVPGPPARRSSSESRVAEALAHPTWEHGRQDHDRLGHPDEQGARADRGPPPVRRSPYEQIEVVVHPQSIIHSLIGLCDGATLAHLGYPDMRVPISYALHFPERVDVPVGPARPGRGLGQLTFESRRRARPSRACAWPARRRGREGPLRAPSTRPTRSRCTRFIGEQDRLPGHRRGDRADAGRAARRARPLVRVAGRRPMQQAREVAGELISAHAPA